MAQYLYRLLRDDEDPLNDGIMGKCPLRDKSPVYHIGKCSTSNKMCQWISTCATRKGLDNMIESKKEKEEEDGLTSTSYRYVVIDIEYLLEYAKRCKRSNEQKINLLETLDDDIVRIVPAREKTGRILHEDDLLRDPESLKEQKSVKKYDEVLVERFIPPHCCLDVIMLERIGNKMFISVIGNPYKKMKNRIMDKKFILALEWLDKKNQQTINQTSLGMIPECPGIYPQLNTTTQMSNYSLYQGRLVWPQQLGSQQMHYSQLNTAQQMYFSQMPQYFPYQTQVVWTQQLGMFQAPSYKEPNTAHYIRMP